MNTNPIRITIAAAALIAALATGAIWCAWLWITFQLILAMQS
jgi:hypothetical protein